MIARARARARNIHNGRSLRQWRLSVLFAQGKEDGWLNQRQKVPRNSPVQALIVLEDARCTDFPTFLAMWVKGEPVKR